MVSVLFATDSAPLIHVQLMSIFEPMLSRIFLHWLENGHQLYVNTKRCSIVCAEKTIHKSNVGSAIIHRRCFIMKLSCPRKSSQAPNIFRTQTKKCFVPLFRVLPHCWTFQFILFYVFVPT